MAIPDIIITILNPHQPRIGSTILCSLPFLHKFCQAHELSMSARLTYYNIILSAHIAPLHCKGLPLSCLYQSSHIDDNLSNAINNLKNSKEPVR